MVSSKMALEETVGDHIKDSNDTGRLVETSALATSRADHVQYPSKSRAVCPTQTFKEGEMVLEAHGKALTSTVK